MGVSILVAFWTDISALPFLLAFFCSVNVIEMSLALSHIEGGSRTDISALWIRGNGLKV